MLGDVPFQDRRGLAETIRWAGEERDFVQADPLQRAPEHRGTHGVNLTSFPTCDRVL
jgi:hypothetical protein